MSAVEYEDRVRAAWYGQIAGTLMGFAAGVVQILAGGPTRRRDHMAAPVAAAA